MDLRVISIGTLSSNPLWSEKGSVRTGHATCTLVRSGKRIILIDPGLPVQAIAARLNERAGLLPKDVTHVFLTTFKPETMRGVMAFDKATWWISQDEREGVGIPLVGNLQKAAADDDDELKRLLEQDVAVLRRCEPAPDRLAEGVDLFPLPGVTPGCCGVLCTTPRSATLICGDAIPTVEHLERGQVLQSAVDVMRARESFGEAVEIADYLVPGRDNIVPNPVKRPF
jgi:glyoxylase-like metal-dependent hydrolase (beta-lactamase superfamily II)